MRILIAMHFEPGHLMGTFRLAKALRERGHSVAYLGIPRVRAIVEKQGFEFVEFAGHLFPDGDAPPADQPAPATPEALFEAYVRAIVDGTLDQCLLGAHPDLLIGDSFLWYVSLRALHLHIPTLQLSTSLFLYDNAHIPPAITGVTPRDSFLSRIRVRLAWKLMHLRFVFIKRIASHLFGAYRAPMRMHHLMSTFYQVARASGYPCKLGKTYVKDEIGAHLILPELVLCTKSFHFPGKLPPERRYCGDFMDFDRQEPPLPLDPAGKTLVFCSLGTSAAAYPQSAHFFNAVVEASRLAPDWHFVLHISDPALVGRYQSTGNLLVTDWVPQLALLRHAEVMVNHGGLNSIMECVQLQVPMVILPCARDQPGNAARAAYHRLALTAKIRAVDGPQLKALIEQAMADPALKDGLLRMKDAIEQEGGLQKAVTFIESFSETARRENSSADGPCLTSPDSLQRP